MTLISELLKLPESVHSGDFVLRLSEGISDEHAAETLAHYVVTPELAVNFDEALGLVKSAVDSRSSKGTFLHGSFGSGKSHFMAVLCLLLRGNPVARNIPELAPVLTKHDAWLNGRRFLMVPYHMIGARSMESAILGRYATFVRQLHPEAPTPGVYLAGSLFDNAVQLRRTMGDEAFFGALNQGAAQANDGWGDLGATWDGARFDRAVTAHAADEDRVRLVGDLVSTLFPAFGSVAAGEGEGFVDLDTGLSIISRHARELGYDGLILFLDELVLWLASNAADQAFIAREGQKISKLVEAQNPNRPVPVISFVARQRDLRDFVGDHIVGAHQVAFHDVIKYWEDRFATITLEDRNLPTIAERRVLAPRSEQARRQIDEAFTQTTRVRDEVMDTLLTPTSDRAMFRKLYPFSPALVQVLVAVSSMLQRERTALKVMLLMLVEQRDTLKLGELLPVGDLFDLVAADGQSLSGPMRKHFESAFRLWVGKLLPLLEQQHGLTEATAARLNVDDPKRRAFRNDARLMKTLLLAALVPQVDAFKALTPTRLAALNHGTFRTPIANQEGSIVLGRLRQWAAQVGEIHLSDDPANPVVSLRITGVDVDAVVAQAQHEDNPGNRLRKIRDLVYEACGITQQGDLYHAHEFVWRGTRRRCEVIFGNVREMPVDSLRSRGDDWKLVIDFPYDADGHTPADDRARVQEFVSTEEPSHTIAWIPGFFSRQTLQDLGKLVILDHVLAGERFQGYATHLQPADRANARLLLENQQSQLAHKLKLVIEAAYGLTKSQSGWLDDSFDHELADHFQSLDMSFRLQPPAAANMTGALTNLLDQALTHQYPAHPNFEVEGDVRPAMLKKVLAEVQRATQAPQGRIYIEDQAVRRLMRQIAVPLQLGQMGEQHFVLDQIWTQHFARKQAVSNKPLTVGLLREWIDDPRPRGLPAEVANLVILTWAEQRNLRFVLHGGQVQPSLESLRDEVTLRDVPLPTPEVWTEARRRAATVFGLDLPEMRTASNVADAVEQVRQKAAAWRPSASDLVAKLRSAFEQQLLSMSDSSRGQTATAAHELVSAIDQATPEQTLSALAGARLATSEQAMAKSLSNAATVAAALQNARWPMIASAAGLSDARQESAQHLRARMTEVLTADEYAAALAPALRTLEDDAAVLLAKVVAVPATTPPPVPPPTTVAVPPLPATPSIRPREGQRIVSHAPQASMSVTQARAALDNLRKILDANPNATVTVAWTVESSEA